MFLKQVWDDLFCEMVDYPSGSSKLWPWKDAHGQQQYKKRLWHSSDDKLVMTGPKCAKKSFPTPWHHLHQLRLLTQSRFGPWIYAVGVKFWPYHLCTSAEIEILQPGYIFPKYLFNCSVFVSLCPLQLSVFGRQKLNPMWLSTVVAHPPQGSMCCAFWDAFLLTTIVKSGYLCYCPIWLFSVDLTIKV